MKTMNYSANDNLEIMKLAKNYNGFLIEQILNTIKNEDFKEILDFRCSDGFLLKILQKI